MERSHQAWVFSTQRCLSPLNSSFERKYGINYKDSVPPQPSGPLEDCSIAVSPSIIHVPEDCHQRVGQPGSWLSVPAGCHCPSTFSSGLVQNLTRFSD